VVARIEARSCCSCSVSSSPTISANSSEAVGVGSVTLGGGPYEETGGLGAAQAASRTAVAIVTGRIIPINVTVSSSSMQPTPRIACILGSVAGDHRVRGGRDVFIRRAGPQVPEGESMSSRPVLAWAHSRAFLLCRRSLSDRGPDVDIADIFSNRSSRSARPLAGHGRRALRSRRVVPPWSGGFDSRPRGDLALEQLSSVQANGRRAMGG
jgi:hypothetical protein